MNKTATISLVILITILLVFSTPACGRSIITGQVVDAETGKPIEGAAVYIYWSETGSGPPGLAGQVDVEVAEVLTDPKGLFKAPKYSTWFKDYILVVYMRGYVCWSSERIFPTWEERKGFRLRNGMVIHLKTFRKEYSKDDHARFIVFSSINSSDPGLFNDAIKMERDLFDEIFSRKRRN